MEYRGPDNIRVIVPEHGSRVAGAVLPDLNQLFQALEGIPKNLRPYLHEVVLNPMPNPDDAYWTRLRSAFIKRTDHQRLEDTVGQFGVSKTQRSAALAIIAEVLGYDPNESVKGGKFRSAMLGKPGLGRVNIYPIEKAYDPATLSAAFIHEVGHLWSLTMPFSEWQQRMEEEDFSPSRYASSAEPEDPAELMVVYAATIETPAYDELTEIFPRLQIIHASLGGKKA